MLGQTWLGELGCTNSWAGLDVNSGEQRQHRKHSFVEASRTHCWVGWSLRSQLRGTNTSQGKGLCRQYSHFSAHSCCHPTGPWLSKSYCPSMSQCVVFARINIFRSGFGLIFLLFFFLKQLCCPSENPDSVPGLEEKKLKQLYISWGLRRGTRDLQEHSGQGDSHHQHTHKVPTQQQEWEMRGNHIASVILAPSRKSIFLLK